MTSKLIQDLGAEAALLGSCLDSIRAFAEASDLEAAAFSDRRNGAIWAAMGALAEAEGDFDPIGVARVLDGKVPQAYIFSLLGAAGSGAFVGAYAKAVRDAARVRNMAQGLGAVLRDVSAGGGDPDELIGRAREVVAGAEYTSKRYSVPISEVARRVGLEAVERVEGSGRLLGASTGLAKLDRYTYGLHGTELTICAARPAMGKSALAGGVALSVAKGGGRVAFFSLEMGRDQLAQRFLADLSGLPLEKIRKGGLSSREASALMGATGVLEELPIQIIDKPGMRPEEVALECKRLALTGPLGLVIVDYLQLMRAKSQVIRSREQEVAYCARSLKDLAKAMDCPVLGLSQLNRGVEARADKRPMLSDLRESGEIEQAADVVWLLYREAAYREDADPIAAELAIAKHRGGRTGIVRLAWEGARTRWYDPEVAHGR